MGLRDSPYRSLQWQVHLKLEETRTGGTWQTRFIGTSSSSTSRGHGVTGLTYLGS
jgi:hypothetical protein